MAAAAVRSALPPPPPPPPPLPNGGQQQEMALRFEDLTIDDDLPPLERVTRYCKSSIALQRLVHVKMLAETATICGQEATITSILPLLQPLVLDQESIIRQHVAMQLLPIAFACVGYTPSPEEEVELHRTSLNPTFEQIAKQKPITEGGQFEEKFYKAVIDQILPHLSKLISDSDGDVRQASAASISGIVQHRLLKHTDVPTLILRVPMHLIHNGKQLGNNTEGKHHGASIVASLERGADMRMTGAALLGDLSVSLGSEYLKHFVTPELVSLAQDPAMKVRRVVAGHSIPKACAGADEDDIVNHLFPAFVRLCNDDQKYIRRACADSIVELSRVPHFPSQLRNVELIELWKKLERDSVKAVKNGALQKLGQFIATFVPPQTEAAGNAVFSSPQDIKAPGVNSGDISRRGTKSNAEAVNELIPYYTGMAFMETNDAQEDAELRLHCAFAFPAVVYTVGVNGWGKLRDAFLHLARGPEAEIPGGKPNANNAVVKRCLACSLHEVAKALGGSVVESELIPIFERFLRDQTEEVRFSVLRNFHEFVGVLSIKRRDPLLSLLNEILSTASPMNWRMRDCVAGQLNQLIELFEASSIRNKITPLVFQLLDDPVAEVREKTHSSIASLFKSLFWINLVKKDAPGNFASEADAQEWSFMASSEVLKVLKGLPKMEDFSHRQSYCQICLCVAQSLSDPNSSPEETEHMKNLLVMELLPSALALKDDRVSNVRSLLRKCLHLMTIDIKMLSEVSKALSILDTEEELWEEAPSKKQPSTKQRATVARTSSRSVFTETNAASEAGKESKDTSTVPAKGGGEDQLNLISSAAPATSTSATVIPAAASATSASGKPPIRGQDDNISVSTKSADTTVTSVVEEAVARDDSKENERDDTGIVGCDGASASLKDGQQVDTTLLAEQTEATVDDDEGSVASTRSASSWLSSSSRRSTSSRKSGKLNMFGKKKKEAKTEEDEVASTQSTEKCSVADDEWSLSASSLTSPSLSQRKESSEEKKETDRAMEKKEEPRPYELPKESMNDDDVSVASTSSRSVSSWLSSSSRKSKSSRKKEKSKSSRKKKQEKSKTVDVIDETPKPSEENHQDTENGDDGSVASIRSASSWLSSSSRRSASSRSKEDRKVLGEKKQQPEADEEDMASLASI